MACCLTAPSHYLNQCWLISKVEWRSSKGKFTRDTSAINHWNYLENLVPKWHSNFPVNCSEKMEHRSYLELTKDNQAFFVHRVYCDYLYKIDHVIIRPYVTAFFDWFTVAHGTGSGKVIIGPEQNILNIQHFHFHFMRHGRALGCQLSVFWRKLTILSPNFTAYLWVFLKGVMMWSIHTLCLARPPIFMGSLWAVYCAACLAGPHSRERSYLLRNHFWT